MNITTRPQPRLDGRLNRRSSESRSNSASSVVVAVKCGVPLELGTLEPVPKEINSGPGLRTPRGLRAGLAHRPRLRIEILASETGVDYNAPSWLGFLLLSFLRISRSRVCSVRLSFPRFPTDTSPVPRPRALYTTTQGGVPKAPPGDGPQLIQPHPFCKSRTASLPPLTQAPPFKLEHVEYHTSTLALPA